MKKERKIYLPNPSCPLWVFETMARKSKRRSAFGWKQIALIFAFGLIALAGLALALIGFLDNNPFSLPQREIAATVNGEPITMDELDASYAAGIPLEYQQFFTRWQFLNESVIPQKLLLQAATSAGFGASDEDVEFAIKSFLAQSRMTEKQLAQELSATGLSRNDMEATLRIRLTIAYYVNATILTGISVTRKEIEDAYEANQLDIQDIPIEEAEPYLTHQILMEKQGEAVLLAIDALWENATIIIFLEEAKQGIPSFQESESEICSADGKPIVRMFTLSTCTSCERVAKRLQKILASSPAIKAEVIGSIWELDTGDDLLTPRKEGGVPQSEIDYFMQLSPNREVPAYSFGCKYVRIGNLPGSEGNLNAEEKEFNDVISTVLVENG